MKLDRKCEQSPNASGFRRGTSGAGSQAHAGSLLGLRAAKGLSMVGSTCLPISSPKLKNTISITECITTMEKLAYQKKWKYAAKFMLQYANLIIVSEEFISDGFFFVSCLSFTFSHMTTYILIPFSLMVKNFFQWPVAITEHSESWNVFKKIKINYHPTSWIYRLLLVTYSRCWDFHAYVFLSFNIFSANSVETWFKKSKTFLYIWVYHTLLHYIINHISSFIFFYFKYPPICCCYHMVLNGLIIFRTNKRMFTSLQKDCSHRHPHP